MTILFDPSPADRAPVAPTCRSCGSRECDPRADAGAAWDAVWLVRAAIVAAVMAEVLTLGFTL